MEKAVRESGYSITRLAEKMEVSRRHVYNLFESDKIDWDVIVQIGTIIKYDFSKDFKELVQFGPISHVNDPAGAYIRGVKGKLQPAKMGPKELALEVSYWKNRYIELLEKYNDALLSKVPNVSATKKGGK